MCRIPLCTNVEFHIKFSRRDLVLAANSPFFFRQTAHTPDSSTGIYNTTFYINYSFTTDHHHIPRGVLTKRDKKIYHVVFLEKLNIRMKSIIYLILINYFQ